MHQVLTETVWCAGDMQPQSVRRPSAVCVVHYMRCMLRRCKNDRQPQLYATMAQSLCCMCCVMFLHVHFS